MTNAYYVQKAGEIFPIFGVSTMEEAREYVLQEDWQYLVETPEEIYMNPATGSVDFESGWNDLDDVVLVRYSAESESWIEV